MRSMLRGRRPSPAMIVALIALLVALGGSAYAVQKIGSKQLKKNAVTTKKIKNLAVTRGKLADDAVDSGKIANKAVTSGKFFLSSVTNLNFGQVNASDCSGSPGNTPSLNIPVAGITATDHVVVTPPPGWAQTFVLTAIPNPAGNAVTLAACNNFFAGSGDPDGNGGPYKLLVIR